MIQDLVDLLDRSWRFLDEETGFDFVINCFPFLQQLLRDSRTSALLADFRREEQKSRMARIRADDDARASLKQLLDLLEISAPDSFEPPPKDRDDNDISLLALRRLLTPPSVDLEEEALDAGREFRSDRRLETVIAVLEQIAQGTNREALRERIDNVKRALEHAKRTNRTFFRTSAAAALARIERDLNHLHPPAGKMGEKAELEHLLRTRDQRFVRIRDALFGTRPRISTDISGEIEIEGKSDVLRMRKDMRRIYEEIRRRLGAERSLLAVFERYRQRCQWYEAEKLQAIARSGPGKPEDRLTETLATYLFDHGLNPLIRPMVGRFQPDILGSDAPFSFYVEAKQYTRAAPKYLLDGMHQVWDMLDQLRGSGFDVAEAFYVVYRRGGPSYTFREPQVRHRDRVVHLFMIDLAPSAERGSNAKQSYVLETSDLMPRAAVPPDRQRRIPKHHARVAR